MRERFFKNQNLTQVHATVYIRTHRYPWVIHWKTHGCPQVIKEQLMDGLKILEKIKIHSRRGASRNLIKVSKRIMLYKENPENT
jgi:hypothetical protein